MLDEPATGKEFFDREELMDGLMKKFNQANKGKKRNIALIGLRKVGKTSILWEFMNRSKYPLQIYLYIKPKPTRMVFRKMLGLILCRYLGNTEVLLATDESLRKLSMDCIETNPRIGRFSLQIIDQIDKAPEAEELLSLILRLLTEISKEKLVILIFDEFQHFALWDENIIETLRENLMEQSQVWWIIAGSAVSMMESIINSETSPLYGHFKSIYVEPFEYKDARMFLERLLDGISIKEAHLNFLIQITAGYPYHLAALGSTLEDVTREWKIRQISKPALLEAITRQLFYKSGDIYKYSYQLVVNTLEKRGLETYLSILKAISLGNHKFSEIARAIEKPGSSLTYPLDRLIELDLIVKKNGGYLVLDPLLDLWLKYVYTLREDSYIPELDLKVEKFKSQISQMISEFKSELGKARESQIREIFSKKGFTMNSGNLEGEEFDLIARKDNELFLGECKTGNITTTAVTNFIRKIEKAERKHKAEKKILFSLFGITEKARDLCKKEGIEIWNLQRINRERTKAGLSKIRV